MVVDLLRPYRGRLVIVFIAMLVEIAASLAAPWTLKLVLDDALGQHRLPEWLAWAHDYGSGRHAMGVALFAGLATPIIAIIGAVATYIDNYYTTNIGQWVAERSARPHLPALAPALAAPDAKSGLIWCPNNGRERTATFIDSAKHTLWIQNERYQDTVIIERLVRAVYRGVRVHIMARPPHKLKTSKLVEGGGGLRVMEDVGAKIHRLKHLKLHGKMLLADEERAIVGSINLTPGSFDARRELAIETDSRHVVERLVKISHHDWKHSRALDLSDEGLLAELEKHKIEGARQLALQPSAEKRTHAE